jgi:hypothetical protein
MRTDRKKKLLLPLAVSLLTVLMILEGPALLQGRGFGGISAQAAQSNLYSVHVDSGYLALRTAKAYDYSNEIGKLYTGDQVQVTDTSDSVYWYVYAPGLGKYGYVNSKYLTAVNGSPAYSVAGVAMTVRVDSGYLALRNGKAYDASNEIGKMYTGETVYVIDMNDPDYWTVYSPKLGLTGYTNQHYLYAVNGSFPSYDAMTVRVQSGYLALRTAKAYDASNEIGKLYTGDTVYIEDTSDSRYWWVYAPTLGQEGYVNKDYLTGGTFYTYSLGSWTVSVQSGYLALRTAKAYDASNEIGKLYTGETVQVIDASDSQYWYVYAPSLNLYGYVNANYLY